MNQNNKLLTRAEAAEFLGVSKGTLEVWASTKRYNLKYIKVGSLAKYRMQDLLDYLDAQTRKNSENCNNKTN